MAAALTTVDRTRGHPAVRAPLLVREPLDNDLTHVVIVLADSLRLMRDRHDPEPVQAEQTAS